MTNQQWQDTLTALDSVQNGNLIDEAKVNNWLQSWGSKNENKAPSESAIYLSRTTRYTTF